MSEQKVGRSQVTAKLSVMMFLQFFVWGSWYVTAPNYLGKIGFGAADFTWTYSVGPIACIISPFFVGMIADRFFSAQKVMGVLHFLGGLIMLFAATQMKPGVDPSLINWIFFAHVLCYFPTLSLSNTIALSNIRDPEKQFPLIRVFGTIGWIIAGLALSWLLWDTEVNMFKLSGYGALLLGVYSFFLPATPPTGTGKISIRQVLGLDSLVLLKNRAYLVFILCSMLICIPLAFYYQIASRVVEMSGLPIGQTMSYGQMSEIFFMLIMPLFFARLGVKWMLALGMLAWVVRYALFAFGASSGLVWMIIAGVVLHGICYDFFFVTGQIYTDKKAKKGIQGQAQGLLVLFTLGIGMLIGAQVAGKVEAANTPAVAATYGDEMAANGKRIEALEAKAENSPSPALSAEKKELEQANAALKKQQLNSLDWKSLWLFPAIFAAVVLVIFLLFFRDRVNRGTDELAETPEIAQ